MRIASFLLFCAVVTSGFCHADEMRVAVVDVRKIFDSWDYTIKSKQNIKRLKDAFQKENNERLAVINQHQMVRSRLYQQFSSNKETMSEEDKKKMDTEFRNIGREVKVLEQNRRDYIERGKRRISTEESDIAKLILDRITEAIQVYALEKKFHMVIEMGGHTTRNMPLFLHLEGAEDISDEIISRLNDS